MVSPHAVSIAAFRDAAFVRSGLEMFECANNRGFDVVGEGAIVGIRVLTRALKQLAIEPESHRLAHSASLFLDSQSPVFTFVIRSSNASVPSAGHKRGKGGRLSLKSFDFQQVV
ncbi:hypothetical protein KRR38_11315 [Novosphingobium sp. G106]|uniref:hypothetical protein n=1 Tax=Novosphingobium sp. G106 TaxID=2849500 RepID=UPI001C2CC7D3|nr:hypothetical protein [Novosphingobium sp. G106]MBV1688248.1 hypothetical protein [Novosphingobium sp. G106]